MHLRNVIRFANGTAHPKSISSWKLIYQTLEYSQEGFMFSDQNSACIFISPMPWYMSRSSHSLLFGQLNHRNVWWEVQTCKLLTAHFSPASCYCTLDTHILLTPLFSNTRNPGSLLNVRGQFSNAYKGGLLSALTRKSIQNINFSVAEFMVLLHKRMMMFILYFHRYARFLSQ
jgi:hypothetical protein